MEVNQYIAADHPLQKVSVHVSQVLIYPLLLTLRLLVVRSKLHRDDAGLDLAKNSSGTKYVLYANHQSKLPTAWRHLPCDSMAY